MNDTAKAWAFYLWGVLTLAPIGYELYTVFSGNSSVLPLTDVLVEKVPWWAMLPGLSWLLIHFVYHYTKAGKIPGI